MQRDESDDGRRSLGSCCPEDVAVECRLPRESDPRPRGLHPVQSDDASPSGAAPGFDGAGSIRHRSQNFLRRGG